METNSSDPVSWFILSHSSILYLILFFFALYLWLHDHILETWQSKALREKETSFEGKKPRTFFQHLHPSLRSYRRIVHVLLMVFSLVLLTEIDLSTLFGDARQIIRFVLLYPLLLLGAGLGRWIGHRTVSTNLRWWSLPAWLFFYLEDLVLEPFELLSRAMKREGPSPDAAPNSEADGTGEADVGALTVSDVMIPRVEVLTVPEQTRLRELLKNLPQARLPYVLVESGDRSRRNGTNGEILGILPVTRILAEIQDPARLDQPVGVFPLEKPRVFADSQRLITVWSLWAADESQFPVALVYDEFGSFQGVLRREDVAAALLLQHTRALVHRYIRRAGKDLWRVSGRCPIELFWHYMDLEQDELPAGVETVAGWVGSLFAHLPRIHETTEAHGLQIRVTRVTKNRIEEIQVRPLRPRRKPIPVHLVEPARDA